MKELRELMGDETRQELDASVAKALGIPKDEMEKTRLALASEPAITGITFTGEAATGGFQ